MIFLLFIVKIVLSTTQGMCPNQTQINANLKFTKHITSYDFVYIARYKELSCCADGYTYITWQHGNKSSINDTSFVISPRDSRVITSKYVRNTDSGTYTCIVHNSTHTISHTVNLTVYISPYNGRPLFATRPVDQWAEIGEEAEFLCSVFIGFGAERQHISQIYWTRSEDAFTFAERANHSFERHVNYSPDGEIVSSYFTIPKVDQEDFGQYLCVANNGVGESLMEKVYLHRGIDPATRIRYSPTLALSLFVTFVVTTIVVTAVYVKNRTIIHLFCKDRFARLEDRDETRRYDVFICYSSTDGSELVLGWLVPRLEQHYGYSCFAFERDMHGGEWMPDVFAARIRESRRFLLVLSQGVLRDGLCRLACQLAIQEALAPTRALRLICAWPPMPRREELVKAMDPAGALRLVVSVAKKATLPPSTGSTQKHQAKFWRQLRLRLPPRRPEPSVPEPYQPLNTTSQL